MATPCDPLLKTKQNKIHDKTRCSLKCQPSPPPSTWGARGSSKQYFEGGMGGACKGCRRKKSVSGEGWGRK